MSDSKKKLEVEIVDPRVISELLNHAVESNLDVAGSQVVRVQLQGELDANATAQRIADGRNAQAETQVDLLRRASLGDVVAGITHQSRNIMTGVLSFSQIAQRRNADPKLEQVLQSIHDESARCVELMNQILVLARSREAFVHQSHGQLDLAEIIESACGLTEPAMAASHIRLENKVASKGLRLIGDASSLRDLFVNLLRNATDAIRDGGTIRVCAEQGNDTLLISVEDSGPGIAAADREKVFAPSFTTKGAGKGTGLGLAISQQVVGEHKGEIRVEDSSLGGARFVVTFPLMKAEDETL